MSFRCFMLNLGAQIETWTEPFIQSMEVDCYNSVNQDRVQVLNYSKYSLLQPLNDFTQKYFQTKHHASLSNNSKWIFEIYKPNISINLWYTFLDYHIRWFYISTCLLSNFISEI